MTSSALVSLLTQVNLVLLVRAEDSGDPVEDERASVMECLGSPEQVKLRLLGPGRHQLLVLLTAGLNDAVSKRLARLVQQMQAIEYLKRVVGELVFWTEAESTEIEVQLAH